MSLRLSVLIPAHNESAYITDCLQALFASAPLPADAEVEVLVLANGCNDDTAAKARLTQQPEGWSLKVIDLPLGGKLAALNAGDAQACGDILVYLDADVRLDPDLLPELLRALASPMPLYASGTPRICPARSRFTRAYARFWTQLPFVTTGAPGFGLFAMTRAGRQRWGDWPEIISDDTFARLSFAPEERLRLRAGYDWPMVEGFRNLVRVRRRQNIGVEEISARFPALCQNDDARTMTKVQLARLLMLYPVGALAYLAVTVAVRTPLFASKERWTRGR